MKPFWLQDNNIAQLDFYKPHGSNCVYRTEELLQFMVNILIFPIQIRANITTTHTYVNVRQFMENYVEKKTFKKIMFIH